MRFQVGDLVSERLGDDLGLVVSVDKANSKSLGSSIHSNSHIENSFDIYYVFFPENGRVHGPYYPAELNLKVGII